MGDTVFSRGVLAGCAGAGRTLGPDIPPESVAADKNWEQPVDLITPSHHTAVLARKVAARIKHMLDTGAQIVTRQGPRPVHCR